MSPVFASPQEAEAAFYEALARSDLESMMSVWSEEEEVVCIHPGGTRLVGLAAVREAWSELFAARARLVIRLEREVVSASLVQAVHNVLEFISVEGETQFSPPVAATNVYARGAHGWRMVMHHASPLPESSDLHETPRIIH